MKEKQCFMCKITKSLNEFYKNKTRLDGYYNDCKVCTDIRVKNFLKTDKGKRFKDKQNSNYRKNNPNKVKAHNAVNNARTAGKVFKQPCKMCGELKVEAHHYLGYEEVHWLDIEWLCKKHHMEAEKICL